VGSWSEACDAAGVKRGDVWSSPGHTLVKRIAGHGCEFRLYRKSIVRKFREIIDMTSTTCFGARIMNEFKM